MKCKDCGTKIEELNKDVWEKKYRESGLCYYCFRIMENQKDPRVGCKLPIAQYKKDQDKRRIKNGWIMGAKFISTTHSGKSSTLDRWECPNCRNNKEAECRFNLDRKKRGRVWKCRFCKIKLILEVLE